MRRPIRALESLAPSVRHANHDHPASAEADGRRRPSRPTGRPGGPRRGGRYRAALATPARPSAWTLLKRVPLVLARLLLELVPVLGIAVVGHLIAGSSLGGQTVSRLIILAVIDAYAVCAALLCVARMLLSPDAAAAAAVPSARHHRRLPDALDRAGSSLIAVFGYAIGEVGLLLGLSDLAHDAMQKAVGLLLHLCLALSSWCRSAGRCARLTARAGGRQPAVCRGCATASPAIWHWVALFFLVAVWLVWAVEVPHGYAVVLHYFVVTALVLIGARLAAAAAAAWSTG